MLRPINETLFGKYYANARISFQNCVFNCCNVCFPLYLCHDLIIMINFSTLQDGLLNPLQDKVEEWKKTSNNLDKEHSKGKNKNN